MNREIFFRGKSIISNEWLYGNLIISEDNHFFIVPFDEIEEDGHHIRTKDNYCEGHYAVEPETIGQYIGGKGFIDKENEHFTKGKSVEVKLFEGDIVESWSQGSKGTFMIKLRPDSSPMFILYPAWQCGEMWSIHFSDVGRDKGDYYDDLRVMGNIYDNPEMLKNK